MHDKKEVTALFSGKSSTFKRLVTLKKTLHLVPKLYVVDKGFLNLYPFKLSQNPPGEKRG
jgi:hypothetical protein